MSPWCIAIATGADRADWAALRADLWPDASTTDHAVAISERLAGEGGIAFVARDRSGAPVGFAEASIRRDDVPGCDGPLVLFLEGIFTAPAVRRRELGPALVAAVAAHGQARGLHEFASDAALDDVASHGFQRALGSAETERLVFLRRQVAR